MREIKSHTALRGIAALLVVLFHYKNNLAYEAKIDGLTGFLETSDRFVDFFFMLSGFVMGHVYLDRISRPGEKYVFLVSRLARVYPLHALTLTTMVLLSLVAGAEISDAYMATIIRNIFLLQAWGAQDAFIFNFPSWSISAEWAAYLLFPVIAAIVVRSSFGQIVLAVLSVCAVFLEHYLVNSLGVRWERVCLLRAIPLFALGVLLFSRQDVLASFSRSSLTLLQVIVTLAIILAMHFSAPLILLLPLFAILILSTHSDEGFLPRVLDNTPLQVLGLISYTIYLLHIPVQQVGYFVWPKVEGLLPSALRETAFVVICVLTTIGLGLLVYRCFEMPMRTSLRRRFSFRGASNRTS